MPPLVPLVVHAQYLVAWNGITIGRINMDVQEDATQYALTVDTKTHGIGLLFKTERRIAEANGTVENGHYIPNHFESRPQGKDEGVRNTILYDATGAIQSREQVPPDDPNWRPTVPIAQANTATDPVSAGLILRRKLYEAMAKGTHEVAIKTYDGSRLAEMHFVALQPTARVEMLDSYTDAVDTVVTRQPITGYTPKEMKKYNAGDPVIHLYFTANPQFIPIRTTVSMPIGELSVSLVEMH